MTEIVLTAQEMYAIDRYTIEEVGIPSMVLMERASFSAFQILEKGLPREDRIIIVCGMGNNGADGVALGRMLALSGYSVDLFLLGKRASASEQMLEQLRIAENIKLNFLEEANLDNYQVIIDAIFGIGINRDIQGHLFQIMDRINREKGRAKLISLDMPSGVSGDSGQAVNIYVKADLTITFGFLKQGLTNKDFSDHIQVTDIGYPQALLKEKGFF